MELKFKPFDVPKRPDPFKVWSVPHWYAYVGLLAFGAAATESWWSVLLVGYTLGWLVIFRLREWRWHAYADRCERTFVEIGQAADSLGEHLKAIAAAVEARQAAPAPKPDPVEPKTMPIVVDGPESVTVLVNPRDIVTYWVADSNGKN